MLIRKEKLLGFLPMLWGFQKPTSPLKLSLVILLHLIGWMIFFSSPLLFFDVQITDNSFLLKEFINKLFLVAAFYFNYFYLLPKFFETRKFPLYFFWLFVTFLGLVIQQLALENFFFDDLIPRPNLTIAAPFNERVMVNTKGVIFMKSIPPKDSATFQTALFPPEGMVNTKGVIFMKSIPPDDSATFQTALFPPEGNFLDIPNGFWMMRLQNVASSLFLLILLGAFIRLTYTLVKQQDEKKALENANLNAEVNLLKSQINPHFLFNTLNSIYALAHARSAKTEYSVLKLSEIFRYVIYDSSNSKIALSKDIDYINNYIELQRLRILEKVSIDYQVRGNTDGLEIAPLLLITFIENAFKHGISYKQASTIQISIHISATNLCLFVSNPVIHQEEENKGGLGLKNAKRRLELLYPDQYLLCVRKENETYDVNLSINLK
jgi:two-component system LytT family sensor kinase